MRVTVAGFDGNTRVFREVTEVSFLTRNSVDTIYELDRGTRVLLVNPDSAATILAESDAEDAA